MILFQKKGSKGQLISECLESKKWLNHKYKLHFITLNSPILFAN